MVTTRSKTPKTQASFEDFVDGGVSVKPAATKSKGKATPMKGRMSKMPSHPLTVPSPLPKTRTKQKTI